MARRLPTLCCAWSVLVAACTQPDISAPDWDPLEPSEVRAALREPTGELADVSAEALEDALSEVAPVIIEVARYLATVVQIVAEVSEQQGLAPGDARVDSGAGSSGRRAVVGAQAFVELACPGSTLDPPFRFDDGQVRIDSPVLESLADLPLLLHGADLLLDFRGCNLGEVPLEGAAPSLFDLELELPTGVPPESHGFGVALDFVGLTYGERVLPLGVIAFGCAGASTCGEQQAVSAQLLAGELGSYTLSFVLTRDYVENPTTLTLALAAADGEALCRFDGQSQRVTCATR